MREEWSLHDIEVDVLNCDIVVSSNSRSINTLREDMNLLKTHTHIPGLSNTTIVFSTRIARRLICNLKIKTTK